MKAFLAANGLRMILARSHMDQQLSFLHKISEPRRLHGWPIVGYQRNLARKLMPQINDLFECALHHGNQVQCRFGLGDLRDQIKPTQVLGQTTDPIRLTVLGDIVRKISCSNSLRFPSAFSICRRRSACSRRSRPICCGCSKPWLLSTR